MTVPVRASIGPPIATPIAAAFGAISPSAATIAANSASPSRDCVGHARRARIVPSRVPVTTLVVVPPTLTPAK